MKRPDGTLPLIQLSPDWEAAFERYQLDGATGRGDVALPPDMFQKLAIGLAQSIGQAAEQGNHAAIVTSARRRRFVHDIMAARGLPNPVIAYEEIGPATTPAILGSVAA